jgi:Leucine-rich repeat (LRR) protein
MTAGCYFQGSAAHEPRGCILESEKTMIDRVRYRWFLGATVALLGLVAAGPSQEKDASSPDQINKLKKLGARIQFDDKKQVIGVNLGERRVADADLVHLKGLKDLEELDLTRTRITSVGLVHLKDLATLRKLFLTDTKVDDSGISNLKGLKALETLGLSGTKIGDSGLNHLQELTGLKSLFCIGTGVTDAGVEKLQKALPKCRIAH